MRPSQWARLATVAATIAGLLLAVGPASLRAQIRPPTFAPTRDDPHAQIIAMLQSSDARHQAWGAWLAERNTLTGTVPLLEQVVVRNISAGSMASIAATDIALDALIQLDARVAPDFVLLVHDRRPAQALVLLAKLGDEANDTLMTLLRHETGGSWFVAANLAIARRLPAVAFVLLERIEIAASVAVSDGGNVGFGTGGGATVCRSSRPVDGFPPWASYELTSVAHRGFVVVAVGPQPRYSIYYRRTVAPAGHMPGTSVDLWMSPPSARDRLKYVAALGNFPDASMPLKGDEQYSIAWHGAEALNAAIVRIREDLMERHQRLVRMLMDKQLLTEDETEALPTPTITINVRDFRAVRGGNIERVYR